MIKVLLVDDEPLCLIGLQGMIDWNGLGFEVIATARNGRDALEIIQARRPEVVVTDLMMPVMGGLELAEKCREADDALPVFIMLTNYEEFDYARQSLRLGAVEYLVKIDLTEEALSSALLRAKERVDKELALRAPDGVTDGLGQYRDLLFLRLYSGLYEAGPGFERDCAALGLCFDAPWYVVACAAPEDRGLPPEQAATLCAGVSGMAADVLPRYLPGAYVSGMGLRGFAVLIPLDGPDGLETRIGPALEQAGKVLFQYFSAKIRWAVGLPVADVFLVKDSLRPASSLLTQMEMEPGAAVGFCREEPATPLDYRAQTVARIQDYIRAHLGDRLSLNEVASVFNFSPNYLSQLFSQSGEAGFVEFVSATRIDSAKELMAATQLRIYEISDRVGFESASYFSKVFKKLEGVSPRAYLQRIRGGKED